MNTLLIVAQTLTFVLAIGILALFGIMAHLLTRAAYWATYTEVTQNAILLFGRLSLFAAGCLAIAAARLA